MPRRCGRAPWRRGAPRPYVVHIGLTPHRWGGFSRENWEFETHRRRTLDEHAKTGSAMQRSIKENPTRVEQAIETYREQIHLAAEREGELTRLAARSDSRGENRLASLVS